MAKTDLRARPMFHAADSIHEHLTVVFTALAISRHLQDATGLSIRKIIRTLRDVIISIDANEIVADYTLVREEPSNHLIESDTVKQTVGARITPGTIREVAEPPHRTGSGLILRRVRPGCHLDER